MSWRRLGGVNRQRKQPGVISFQGFPHGLNTSVPAQRIAKTEASGLINWVIRPGGELLTRYAIKKYTTQATTSNSQVDTIKKVSIKGVQYTLLVDANRVLYYLDSSPKPVSIGTTEGATQIIGYNGVAIILDGSYIKYCDTVGSIKIAYDSGSGTSGFQLDKSGLSNDTYTALGDGTNSRVAQKYTSQAWTAGYTIPPITVKAYLSKAGTPHASAVTARIRKVSDDSIIASATLISNAATGVAASATQYTATFTVTNEMTPSTDYYLSLEHSGGDLANYVKVHCHTVTSGGAGYHYTAFWVDEATKDYLMTLSPGRPPKGAFGEIRGNRLFVSGDPDNPGLVWYGNLTYLDWSTTDGGGYFGSVDDSTNNFEVGGLVTLFGDLYIFGKQNQPYLTKLTGADPSAFDQSLLFQRAWSTHKTLTSSTNDIWAGSGDGVETLSGVQEYGDLRTFSVSEPVKDRLADYWATSTAFAAYYPDDGQYWLVMPTHHRVLIGHTKNPVASPEGNATRYPWCEYEFYRDELTDSDYFTWAASGSGTNEFYLTAAGGGNPGLTTHPDFITLNGTKITEGTVGSLNDHEWDYGDNDTLGYSTVYLRDETGTPASSGVVVRSIFLPTALCQAGDSFLLGGSDGYVWKLDKNEYKDNEKVHIRPICKTAYIEVPMSWASADTIHLMASSKGGGQMDIEFYVDGKQVTQQTNKTITLSVYDGLTVDEASIIDVDDTFFDIDMTQDRYFYHVNFNFHSLMVVFTDVTISGYPIYLNGALIKYRGLSF